MTKIFTEVEKLAPFRLGVPPLAQKGSLFSQYILFWTKGQVSFEKAMKQ